jgi:hypothetical protein
MYFQILKVKGKMAKKAECMNPIQIKTLEMRSITKRKIVFSEVQLI